MDTTTSTATYYKLDGSLHVISPDDLEKCLSVSEGATEAESQEFEDSAAGERSRAQVAETERHRQGAHELMAELESSLAAVTKALNQPVGVRLAAHRPTRHRRASGARSVRTRGSRRGSSSRGDPDDLGDKPPADSRFLTGGRR